MFDAILLADGQTGGSNAALVTFAFYTLAVFVVAGLSSRLRRTKSFLSEYFLGSRSLGVWAFALTFAASSASGGSFMGFPSKIYTHGWILALWIGSYMLMPVLTMGLIGKRLNQMARKTCAITIPDVLRDRFESVGLGVLTTLLIIFFMAFNLVAQFKAGALMLSTLLDDVPLFQAGMHWTGGLIEGKALVGGVDPAYLICLVSFAAAVILYTTYGGFRAVVWTDVLQGIIMFVGVMCMLPLTLWQVGGLSRATDELGKMTPPEYRTARLYVAEPPDEDLAVPFGTWIATGGPEEGSKRVFRIAKRAVIRAGQREAEFVEDGLRRTEIPVLEITTPEEVRRIEPRRLEVPLELRVVGSEEYRYGAGTRGVYVSGPGPSPTDPTGFLPLSLAISFFFMWTFAVAGHPNIMVRLMAFNTSRTFQRSVFTVTVYYSLIYISLVVIFCCARVLLPGMEIESDRIMPAMVEHLTAAAGWPWLAGLFLAAPFAAVMSTVDSHLLVISSAVVRDVYQRNINPLASQSIIRRMSYAVTILVGVAALLGALNPAEYLQDIIVYTGSGLGACFLAPVVLALYWPRLNAAGAIAGMLSGFLFHLALYGAGMLVHGGFQAVRIGNFDPLLPAMAVSFVATIGVALITSPPPQHLVRKFFYLKP